VDTSAPAAIPLRVAEKPGIIRIIPVTELRQNYPSTNQAAIEHLLN
jgi:hypothetical protein